MSGSSSGALVALRFSASHSIFLPSPLSAAQTARLPSRMVSVSGAGVVGEVRHGRRAAADRADPFLEMAGRHADT